MILNDEINGILVRPIPHRAKLHAVIDACHSSTVLDFPYLCRINGLQVLFDHQSAIRMSGMSEKAYMRSFNAMHNGIGVSRAKLDVRELAIQFGCVRLVSFVQKGLSLYKDRFLAALPASQRANTDFNRPVFAAVAFYLCAKRHKVGHN